MARNVGVPRLGVSREGLAVHHLADAASQGAHPEDPRPTLWWGPVDGLAFGLQHLLVERGQRQPWNVQLYFNV